MTGFAKLLRTTAFKLSLAYLLVFTLFAFFALGYVAWNAVRVLDIEAENTIEAEVRGLSEQYQEGGIRQLAEVVERRASQPGASLYHLTTPQGEEVAGNVADLPAGFLQSTGALHVLYRRVDEPQGKPRLALMRVIQLPAGFRVVVGRDLEERLHLRRAVLRTFFWALALVALLGSLGALFVARRVLRRVDQMTSTTERIIAGDLAGRLAIAGNGDEFDRLARNLNVMLDRISDLMTGMKEVSDNIAHDLKTPLTRLRNKAEAALREGRSDAEHRQALESVMEESDGLIKVFDALLTIARLESGNARPVFAPFDIAEMLRDLAELYEPIAEEAGFVLAATAPASLSVVGNRELVGQALANLLDNALKYGRPSSGAAQIALNVKADEHGGVEIVVADNGAGIPAQDRERAKERFARLESSRTSAGFGLGLALVGAVARRHGGDLVLADNAPGLRAILRLPRQPPGPQQ